MTKKDYELIASGFHQTMKMHSTHFQTGEPLDTETTRALLNCAINLAVEFKKLNPNFNEYKFYKACGMYGTNN